MAIVGVTTQFTAMAFVSISSMVIFLFKHPQYVAAQIAMTEIDKELQQFNIHVTYTTWFWITAVYTSFIWTPIWAALVADKSKIKQYMDILAYGYPIIIRFVAVYVYVLILMMFYHKLLLINDFLEDFIGDEEKSTRLIKFERKKMFNLYRKRTPLYVLWTIMEIHEKLVRSMNSVTESYKIILLLNIIGNFVQFVFGVRYFKDGIPNELSPIENNAATIGLTIQMIIVYTLCYLIQEKVRFVKQMVNVVIFLIF